MQEWILPHNHGHGDQAKLFFHLLSSENRFSAAAGVFKLLDDPNRVRIFWLLCHSEECVLNIAALTGMSEQAVSHHLQLLKSSGLIESRRDGKETYCRAAETELTKLLHDALDHVLNIACPRLSGKDGTRADNAQKGVQARLRNICCRAHTQAPDGRGLAPASYNKHEHFIDCRRSRL